MCPVVIDTYEFKDFFDRGQFTYGTTLPEIRDKDINEAIAEAEAIFNCGLYPDDDTATRALLYLTAHFLQNDIDAGESGGQQIFNQTSRSVDGISESLAIPDWMLQGEYAMFSTTYWGQKFLMLTSPYLGGAISSVGGATRF